MRTQELEPLSRMIVFAFLFGYLGIYALTRVMYSWLVRRRRNSAGSFVASATLLQPGTLKVWTILLVANYLLLALWIVLIVESSVMLKRPPEFPLPGLTYLIMGFSSGGGLAAASLSSQKMEIRQKGIVSTYLLRWGDIRNYYWRNAPALELHLCPKLWPKQCLIIDPVDREVVQDVLDEAGLKAGRDHHAV